MNVTPLFHFIESLLHRALWRVNKSSILIFKKSSNEVWLDRDIINFYTHTHTHQNLQTVTNNHLCFQVNTEQGFNVGTKKFWEQEYLIQVKQNPSDTPSPQCRIPQYNQPLIHVMESLGEWALKRAFFCSGVTLPFTSVLQAVEHYIITHATFHLLFT